MAITYPTTPNTPTGSTYSDSASVWGSAVITYGTNTYQSTDFSVEYATTKKVQKDSHGVPVRQFTLPEIPTGTANLIVSTATTVIPIPGTTTFTADVTGSMAWFIDKTGTPFKQEDFFIIPISFSQKIN